MDVGEELEGICASDIQFTLEPRPGHGFIVKVGDYRREPVVIAVQPTFDRAVAWLIEQVKSRYPNCKYSRDRLVGEASAESSPSS